MAHPAFNAQYISITSMQLLMVTLTTLCTNYTVTISSQTYTYIQSHILLSPTHSQHTYMHACTPWTCSLDLTPDNLHLKQHGTYANVKHEGMMFMSCTRCICFCMWVNAQTRLGTYVRRGKMGNRHFSSCLFFNWGIYCFVVVFTSLN